MSPERFLSLSGSIDRHRVDPAKIAAPALVLAAASDRLVPPEQSRDLAAALPDAELHILDCLWGHDMFLKEAARLGELVGPFLEE
jgi:homoserine O-acetyltransferase